MALQHRTIAPLQKKTTFPPGEGSLLLPHLKVIPKGPVPQHLEERVMVSISAHVLQVVVFPSGTHALLAVHHPPVLRQLAPGVHRAQENGLELESKAERQMSCWMPPSARGCAWGSWNSRGERGGGAAARPAPVGARPPAGELHQRGHPETGPVKPEEGT